MYFRVILFAVALLAVRAADTEEECRSCDRTKCSHLKFCPFGVGLDSCGCCEICFRSVGDECGAENGKCGDFLTCTEGYCECLEEGPVCGSDGKTYESLCELMSIITSDNGLSVHYREACKKGPVIKSPPKDSIRPDGSILVLDCEASGFPVPSVTWEHNRPDGSSIKLPSDDSLLAVQTRGGPERHMVTGWVQIMKISQKNAGLYTCIAVNNEGETRASARVTVESEPQSKNEI